MGLEGVTATQPQKIKAKKAMIMMPEASYIPLNLYPSSSALGMLIALTLPFGFDPARVVLGRALSSYPSETCDCDWERFSVITESEETLLKAVVVVGGAAGVLRKGLRITGILISR